MGDRTTTSKSASGTGVAKAPEQGSPAGKRADRRLTELAHEELLELCGDLERWLDDERAPR